MEHTLRRDVNPKRGLIIKDGVGNETNFSGKGKLITLSNGRDELSAASLWPTCPTKVSKFKIYFDEILDKVIGVNYDGPTTDTWTNIFIV